MEMWLQVAGRPVRALLMAGGISLLAITTSAQAQIAPQVTQEINSLLGYVEHSECQFVRNGSDYSGPQARAHLEKKLEYLEGKGMVNSTEDFIDLAATKSNMSGRAYEVRCPDGVHPANAWLKGELQRQRQPH